MSVRVMSAAVVALVAASIAFSQQKPPAQEIRLAADTVLDGIPCRRTGGFLNGRRAELHPSGALRACELSAAVLVSGHELPTRSWVYRHDTGQLDYVWLRLDTRLQGHVCRGGGYGAWQTTFHGNGALRTCWLARDETIDDVPCSRATFLGELRGGASTVFAPDGRLQSCRAARSFTYGSGRFRKGERVSPAGSVTDPAHAF
jgi:hypothetical protein